MIKVPADIDRLYPVRKSKKQKTAFIGGVTQYVTELDYEVVVEKGGMGVRNLVIGNPDKAKYLVTAHYGIYFSCRQVGR